MKTFARKAVYGALLASLAGGCHISPGYPSRMPSSEGIAVEQAERRAEPSRCKEEGKIASCTVNLGEKAQVFGMMAEVIAAGANPVLKMRGAQKNDLWDSRLEEREFEYDGQRYKVNTPMVSTGFSSSYEWQNGSTVRDETSFSATMRFLIERVDGKGGETSK